MRSEITNVISNEDIRKVMSMVIHKSNPEHALHPHVHCLDGQYRIDGLSHLDDATLKKLNLYCSVNYIKEMIYTTWNVDRSLPTKRSKIISVEKIENNGDDVYDISMGGLDHFYFANNILVHNTDSVYFSVAEYAKQQNMPFDLTKEEIVDLYIDIGDQVGATFPEFMDKMFNTGIERGKIVGADLEMVGSRGLFLKKKRYAILKYWEDGFRKDVDGKPGEIKAMGLEIKRSDTSKFIQDFLEETLVALLVGETEDQLQKRVLDFKIKFKDRPSIEKGSPKTVKNLSTWTDKYKKDGKCSVGHVLAAIEWNKLRDQMDDKSVPEATDGTKVMVCKLKTNPLGIKSIGYPIDCVNYLPDWFLELPFDDDEMEKTVLTKKLNNIFGILDMDLCLDVSSTLSEDRGFFDWG